MATNFSVTFADIAGLVGVRVWWVEWSWHGGGDGAISLVSGFL